MAIGLEGDRREPVAQEPKATKRNPGRYTVSHGALEALRSLVRAKSSFHQSGMDTPRLAAFKGIVRIFIVMIETLHGIYLYRRRIMYYYRANRIQCSGFGGLMKKIAVVMGSDSDLPKLEPAFAALRSYGIPFRVRILSAHRTPEETAEFASSARGEGYGAIIAAAGKAAHLAGAIAARTTIPVIGVPIQSNALDGLDALLSTVQMPPGVPVATVGIDGAENAAILAAEILSVGDDSIAERLRAARVGMAQSVLRKDGAASDKYATE